VSSGIGKVIIVEQEVLGITKRSNNWKEYMEEALLPVIAKALGVKRGDVTYTDVQRRYDTDSVWVEFTIPNDDYSLTKSEVVSKLSDDSTVKSMTKALENAELGKGNEPEAGKVEVTISKATAQPTSKPTKASSPTKSPKTKKPSAKPSKSPVKDDDDKATDDKVDVPAADDDVVEPLPKSSLGYTTVVQMMSGLDKSDAEYDEFPKMMASVVAAALGVNVDDVSVSSVKTMNKKTSDVAVTYKIVDKYSMSKEQVKSLLEEQAKTMEASLAVNGYKKASLGKLTTSDGKESASDVTAALPKSSKKSSSSKSSSKKSSRKLPERQLTSAKESSWTYGKKGKETVKGDCECGHCRAICNCVC